MKGDRENIKALFLPAQLKYECMCRVTASKKHLHVWADTLCCVFLTKQTAPKNLHLWYITRQDMFGWERLKNISDSISYHQRHQAQHFSSLIVANISTAIREKMTKCIMGLLCQCIRKKSSKMRGHHRRNHESVVLKLWYVYNVSWYNRAAEVRVDICMADKRCFERMNRWWKSEWCSDLKKGIKVPASVLALC